MIMNVLGLHTVIIGQQANLQFFSGVQNVNHLLEILLQMQRLLKPATPGTQQLEEVIPQPQNIVFPTNPN